MSISTYLHLKMLHNIKVQWLYKSYYKEQGINTFKIQCHF